MSWTRLAALPKVRPRWCRHSRNGFELPSAARGSSAFDPAPAVLHVHSSCTAISGGIRTSSIAVAPIEEGEGEATGGGGKHHQDVATRRRFVSASFAGRMNALGGRHCRNGHLQLPRGRSGSRCLCGRRAGGGSRRNRADGCCQCCELFQQFISPQTSTLAAPWARARHFLRRAGPPPAALSIIRGWRAKLPFRLPQPARLSARVPAQALKRPFAGVLP